jgi:branched-chain amino acid aminotransferase
MDKIITDFYVVDHKVYSSKDINYQFNNSSYHTYEVLRCARGVMVFIDDHLRRMKEGIQRLREGATFSEESARNTLFLLIQYNNDLKGNVKLLGKLDHQNVFFAAYGIQHYYPDLTMYSEGIFMRTISIERPNPLIKQIHVAYSISEEIAKNENIGIYESLLVDHKGCITEGSKSNFFLIRNNCLFSAPEDVILHGITRKYVLEIAAAKGISVIHQKISMSDLERYEAAFICGTSPKILPVKKLNDIQFNPKHPILNILMESYSALMETHIQNQQGKFF